MGACNFGSGQSPQPHSDPPNRRIANTTGIGHILVEITRDSLGWAKAPANEAPTEEITRKLGIAEATFYRWKKKYAGLGVAKMRRLKQLKDENRRLKQLVADLTLDKQMLQDVLSKKL